MLHPRYEEFCFMPHAKYTKCEDCLFVLDWQQKISHIPGYVYEHEINYETKGV